MATSLSLENNFMHAVPYSNMAYLSSHGLLMENKTHNITQNTNHKYITSFYFKIMIQLLFATEKKQKYQPLVDILEDDDGWYILGTILKASIQETSTWIASPTSLDNVTSIKCSHLHATNTVDNYQIPHPW